MINQFSFTRVFSAACIGMFLFGVVIITLGSILPSLITKFQLNEIKAGTLTSLLPLGIMGGSLFFGPIVDRHSYKYLLIVCAFMVMIGIEGIAFTDNIHLLQLSIIMIGLGGGGINGGTNALVADISGNNSRSRSANLSLLGVFFGLGALGMPFLLALLSQLYTYYHILVVIGLILVIPILYFALTKFPEPKQAQSVPLKNIRSLIKDINLILLGLILFFQSGVEGIINNWSTLYLQTESSFIQDHSLYALSLFVLSLTLTRVALIFLLNRIRPYRILIVSILVVTLGVICFMVPGLSNREVIGLVLLGSGLAAGFPVVLGYVGALYPQLSGTAFGMVLVIGLSGNILLNFFMGLISHTYGVGVFSMLLLICTLSMAAVLVITLKRISTKIKI